MGLRLKRLEIQGFKSFANRTVFDLADGVTAVVGPNGSGKSNLSEAVRWVLGEQSNLALRGRRGEDIIFAGSGGRAALGMAEVSLTLDNTGGELPVEYNEVTLTRRIFRDGETQYLVNGARVRLRDLLAVTAPLGQSYTVIGQGLVDAALSARPEERRGLFEHAAGIAPFRLKRVEAERRLAETEANCARLRDLRAELEPRLKSLERAAKHAEEWTEARERLTALQRRLFADLWREASAALQAAEEEQARAAGAREEARREIARLTADAERAREQAAAREAERRALAEQAAAIARRSEPLRRDLAVDEERLAAARRRLADLRESAAATGTRLAALDEGREGAAREIAAVEAALAAAREQATALEQTLAAAERERAAALRAERDLAGQVAKLERERLDLHRAIAGAEGRRATLARERERVDAEALAASERLAALAAEREAAEKRLRDQEAALAAAGAAERQARADLEAALAAERAAAGRLAAGERRVAELRARLDGLRKLAASGEGFYSGVRAVLAAAQAGTLAGIVGPVAGVVDVPAELETAIEVALGGHLQDLVVERWADAEAAIAFLKERRAGRATFHPLDSLREGAGGRGAAPEGPGVLGVAADLVGHEPRFQALVRGLLGRVVVVEDLATTRRVLPRLGGGWSIVTRAGEITRASGAVTGGAAARESGLLARERTLRELPKEVERAERERAAADEELTARAADARAAREEAHRRERLTRDGERARDDLRHRLARVERDHQAAREAAAALARRADELARGAAALDAEAARHGERETALAARLAGLERERAAAREALEHGEAAGATERDRLAALRAETAGAEERRRGLRRQEQAIEEQRAAIRREAEGRQGRVAALEREERDLVAAAEGRREALAALDGEARAVTARLDPLDAALAAARRAEAAAAAALHGANEEALRREQAVGGKAVETERRRGELDVLTRRIQDELLGATAGEEVEGLAPPDPAALFAAPAAPLPDDERAALTAQVERLAARLRRLGPPNPDVLAEWESEAERWRFLTEQLSDVESAARSLRGVLAELDQTMAERFQTTFARVAEEFAESFRDLFGGGAARLLLAEGSADGDGGAGGVEIVAQPPGKKLQSLSLLSGGERALTAAALLFAILRVNPSPFCVLDEVDAALDESNVVRFRERLKRLSGNTQFVVITHNRGTIEGADTLYGITMGADSVSRALSLRLDDALARAGG